MSSESDSSSACLTYHIIPARRQQVVSLCQLNLKHDFVTIAEDHFRAGKVEFEHPQEPLVVQRLDLAGMRVEALTPQFQRTCIVQPPNLDIGRDQAARLYGRQNLAQCRRIAAGKNVLL
jgi:hypothetical protein